MLQRWIYMDVSISNNFIFIFFIIMKNYRKAKRPETEFAESIRRFVYSEITMLYYFERSGIAHICVTDSIRAVWTRILSIAKIVLERHLFAKCEHGLKNILQNCVDKNVKKIYKWIIFYKNHITISKKLQNYHYNEQHHKKPK